MCVSMGQFFSCYMFALKDSFEIVNVFSNLSGMLDASTKKRGGKDHSFDSFIVSREKRSG